MAPATRSLLAAPDSTPQLCEIESIWHSSFSCDPSGVPSSKYARRYHSPSQALASTLAASFTASSRQNWANVASPRSTATSAKRCSTSYRKKASQTLSPLPCSPTLSMPSFQSQEPISGKPCTPRRKPCRMARTQCSYRLARAARQVVIRILVRLDGAPFEEANRFVQHAQVAASDDIAAGGQRQPQV